jgi:hypothetical protein
MSRFAGVYRAVVVDNVDPLKQQRLKVRIPEVSPGVDQWAMPCTSGGQTVLPSVGATVWVMFEGGQADRPVWLGVLPGAQR